MILTVQAAEIAACAGNGKTRCARMEMVKRLFFYGVDGQRTGFCIYFANESAAMVATATADSCFAVCYTAVVWTELALNGTIVQTLVIAAFVFFHSKHDSFVDIQFGIAPTIPSKTGLVLRAMANKFFFRPVYLIGHLGQECAATIASPDINAVTV